MLATMHGIAPPNSNPSSLEKRRERPVKTRDFAVAVLIVVSVVFSAPVWAGEIKWELCTDSRLKVPGTNILLESGTANVCVKMDEAFWDKIGDTNFRSRASTKEGRVGDFKSWLRNNTRFSPAFELEIEEYRAANGIQIIVVK